MKRFMTLLMVLFSTHAQAAEGGPFSWIGDQVLPLISDNEYHANVNSPRMHALPAGVRDPMAIAGWRESNCGVVTAVLTNQLGEAASDLKFKISFDYGASRQGKGAYLANIQVLPVDLKVKALYLYSVQASFDSPINVGTATDPVPQVKILIQHRLKDRMIIGGEKLVTDEAVIDGHGQCAVIKRSEAE